MANEVTVKQESNATEEQTRPGRTYVPNVEIRDKYENGSMKVRNGVIVGLCVCQEIDRMTIRLGHLNFSIRICFGFRDSDFGFRAGRVTQRRTGPIRRRLGTGGRSGCRPR